MSISNIFKSMMIGIILTAILLSTYFYTNACIQGNIDLYIDELKVGFILVGLLTAFYIFGYLCHQEQNEIDHRRREDDYTVPQQWFNITVAEKKNKS